VIGIRDSSVELEMTLDRDGGKEEEVVLKFPD
jgi:hypothetical protein